MSVEILRDEIDKKKEEMRVKLREAHRNGDYSMLQRFEVTAVKNPDPAKYYRGVRNHAKSIAAAEQKGLVLTDPKSEASWGITEPVKNGGKMNGDVVLMEMPREKYVERRARIEVTREAQETGFMEDKKDRLNRIYRDEMRGTPHKDIAFDDSTQGAPRTVTVPRSAQSATK